MKFVDNLLNANVNININITVENALALIKQFNLKQNESLIYNDIELTYDVCNENKFLLIQSTINTGFLKIRLTDGKNPENKAGDYHIIFKNEIVQHSVNYKKGVFTVNTYYFGNLKKHVFDNGVDLKIHLNKYIENSY